MPLSVAVVAAVRVSWKDEGNKRDPYYYRKLANDPALCLHSLTPLRTQWYIKYLVLL